MTQKRPKLPKIGFIYLDYVLRFFDRSNFKGWPDKIEHVVYRWGNDKKRFIKEVKKKKIDILIGNIPATAYETFRQIAEELPHVRFVPSLETQFANRSKENVTLFCEKHNLSAPATKIFYDREAGMKYLESCDYPKIVKRSYGPSNYGGYYVHKVKTPDEAKKLFETKKYHPMYIQECIPLRADMRVMLIGHKPVCAFWRVAGEDMELTNTSQGGYMDYNNIPIGALELAVEASKAAKAEYWACDIAEHDGKYYILECATAFAAFPYIRDWIGQYLMWDFSHGHFPKPFIPLFNWEELGKIDSKLLRTMRNIGFSRYIPSADGAYYTNETDSTFDLELAEPSKPEDIPENPYFINIVNEHSLPLAVLEATAGTQEPEIPDDEVISLKDATLTELMTLHGMDEELAVDVMTAIDDKKVKTFDDLKKIDGINKQTLKTWSEKFFAKSIDINGADLQALGQLEGISMKAAEAIIAYREKNGPFPAVEALMNVKGIGNKKLDKIRNLITV